MSIAISPLRGSLMVLFCGVVFSFGGLAFRSTDDVGAWQYLFFRGIGMVVATAIWLAVRQRNALRETFGAVKPIHALAGIVLGSVNCLFIVALDLATVAFVLFAQTLGPVAAAYFTWIFTGQRVSRNVVIATSITTVGVAVMVSGTLAEDLSPWALIALVIPFGFGLYATIIRSSAPVNPSVPILVAGAMLIVLAGGIVQINGGFDLSLRDAAIGTFAGSILLGMPLSLFNVAQRVVPAPDATLLLMVEVVLAPLWVWAFADETPLNSTIAGGLIVTGAVVWLTLVRRSPPKRAFTTRG